MHEKRALGLRSEAFVAEWLKGQGYSIEAQNVRLGAHEIDLVARKGSLTVLCEVRARTGHMIHPAETITPRKYSHLRRAAAKWMATHPESRHVRIDVAAVTVDRAGRSHIEYYEGV